MYAAILLKKKAPSSTHVIYTHSWTPPLKETVRMGNTSTTVDTESHTHSTNSQRGEGSKGEPPTGKQDTSEPPETHETDGEGGEDPLDQEVVSDRLQGLAMPPVLQPGGLTYGRIEYKEGSSTEVSFRVLLICTGVGEQTSEECTLVVKHGMPLRVKDLKTCIEQNYSIPSCCQTLVFESVTLEDQFHLDFYHIRDGDTVNVFYVARGDVEEILEVVNHMMKSYRVIESIQDKLSAQMLSDDLDALVNQNVFWEKVNDLPEIYFTPCSSNKAEVNRNLFVQCGGLDMLQRLHGLLLQQPWSNLPLKIQYLEHSILRTYWNITATFTVRMFVLLYPRTLSYILRSFLRVELDKLSPVEVEMNIYAMREASMSELNRIASEVVYKAMGTLCK